MVRFGVYDGAKANYLRVNENSGPVLSGGGELNIAATHSTFQRLAFRLP